MTLIQRCYAKERCIPIIVIIIITNFCTFALCHFKEKGKLTEPNQLSKLNYHKMSILLFSAAQMIE